MARSPASVLSLAPGLGEGGNLRRWAASRSLPGVPACDDIELAVGVFLSQALGSMSKCGNCTLPVGSSTRRRLCSLTLSWLVYTTVNSEACKVVLSGYTEQGRAHMCRSTTFTSGGLKFRRGSAVSLSLSAQGRSIAITRREQHVSVARHFRSYLCLSAYSISSAAPCHALYSVSARSTLATLTAPSP